MFVPARPRVLLPALGRGALVPAAALAVHQLRFTLAFGGHGAIELQRSGHAYLHSVVPWIMLMIALSAGGFLLSLGRALAAQRSLPRYTLSLLGLWLTCSTMLLALYISQELLEGVFATGHGSGLAEIFASGGWWAIPAALCVGLVLAAVFHGARRILAIAGGRQTLTALPRRRTECMPRPRAFAPPRLLPLALGWSGRGPPG